MKQPYHYSITKVYDYGYDKSAEEGIGQLRVKVNECNYHEHDRHLKKQFINSLKSKSLTTKIIKVLATRKSTGEVTNTFLQGKKSVGPKITKVCYGEKYQQWERQKNHQSHKNMPLL